MTTKDHKKVLELLILQVKNGEFSIDLPVDTVVTLSTLSGQQKGSFSDIPPPSEFPVPYSDNFDCEIYCNAIN